MNNTSTKKSSMDWLEQYVRQHCPCWQDQEDGGLSYFIDIVNKDHAICYNGFYCYNLGIIKDVNELFYHLTVVIGKQINMEYFETQLIRLSA